MLTSEPSIEKLRWIMKMLRDPETGCPWDLKQNFSSITSHTIEEAYEVVDAIEHDDYVELEKELGDLLFQVVFYSHLGMEQQIFDFDSVIAAICEKLIRRHPHVFSGTELTSTQQVTSHWENAKLLERQEKHHTSISNVKTPLSVLANIPKNLPALSQAVKIQKRCAHVGFDWHNIQDVFSKISEELQEVSQELTKEQVNKTALAEELGDLMFAVVNLCRHAKEDPESLLRRANLKFTRRFHGVEAQVLQSGKAFTAHELDELEAYWCNVKEREKNRENDK